jgi:hypothetical protein
MLAADSRFDLIVIGGGLNGAAIAREAALSGCSVLLLERDDFCAGTSAASTRLIHGGLRYLEHAELALVRESLRERERLLAAAPHLVEPLEIYLPLTRDSRRGTLTIRLGMALYDLLSLGKSLPRHRRLGPERLREALPGLAAAGLVGGAAYFDAQVRYPERLVLELALDAAAAGATLATRTAARELVVEAGRIVGVAWQTADRRGIARAPVVVLPEGREQQHLDATAAGPTRQEPRGAHARVVHHQQVARAQEARQVAHPRVLGRAVLQVVRQQARGVAGLDRLLRDRLRREVVVEVLEPHGSRSLWTTPRGGATAATAPWRSPLGQRDSPQGLSGVRPAFEARSKAIGIALQPGRRSAVQEGAGTIVPTPRSVPGGAAERESVFPHGGQREGARKGALPYLFQPGAPSSGASGASIFSRRASVPGCQPR